MLVKYITVIAWIFAVLSTLITSITIYLGIIYQSSFEKTLDHVRGYEKTYNPKRSLIVAVMSWAWIITIYLL